MRPEEAFAALARMCGFKNTRIEGHYPKHFWGDKMAKPEPMSDAKFLELLRLFEDDVRSLVELTFPNGPVQNRHVRQASVIVRRWLCDNELRRLSDQVSVPLTFPMPSVPNIFEKVKSDPNIDYYLAAGAKFDGKPVQFLYHSNAVEPPQWIQNIAVFEYELIKLGKMMKRPMLYFDGETFSMESTLRFACNKLGGAHFDPSREERERKLEAAARYLTFGPPEQDLEAGETGTIHLPLERTGSEVLTGISVVVIFAATMMVNVHLDGEPLFELKQESTAT